MLDLRGINNHNEYYTNHYFSSIFEDNASETISNWRILSKEDDGFRTPWSLLKECAKVYYNISNNYQRVRHIEQSLSMIRDLADICIESLGYPIANFPEIVDDNNFKFPVYLELKKSNGAPLLWIMLAHSQDEEAPLLQRFSFDPNKDSGEDGKNNTDIENLLTRAMFNLPESPRWIIVFGIDSIALIDRNKWNEKRYIEFDLNEIFGRREESTLQAMAVLLHYESLCPGEGPSLLDKLDENSHKHSAGVSQDLKYALRSSIELLGNEVIYDMKNRLGRDLDKNPIDAGQLTIECLRYMYRMLFVLFIESRPELGYAPMKTQSYIKGYSFESLRDISENIREEIDEVGEGYYLHETLAKLYQLIYSGYPESADTLRALTSAETVHDIFTIEPLKAHIFDPEYTKMITESKLRNTVMLRIIDLMSITRSSGNRKDRRGRISYSTLGINQMGAVYEALLSYRGFIADKTLFEVKRAGDKFDELDVGYFIPEDELDNYTEEERVRYDDAERKGKLRSYEKGTFIYRLAGREREKSASYYTPEVLTKTLVKYALKELLQGKTADEILSLTICEPAMGSAAFLNEAINQLAEAYLDLKQKELGDSISYEERFQKLQQVKMYIADRNVYGIDLNPIAVELAEVSLWLNTIYNGGFVPWFGTQLVNGNSLIGARRQCYRVEELTATQKKSVWYNNAPLRIMPSDKRMPKKQVYHFLLGDPGMANYSDKIIKELASEEIKSINNWNKEFVKPYENHELETLLRISKIVDDLWEKQVELRKEVNRKTADFMTVYGQAAQTFDSKTTIREKDWIYSHIYKSEEMQNAGPYARLKFAMDYWCALWFWPIDKADLLPTRSEFLFDMSLILEGGIVSINQLAASGQLSMFPTPLEEMANKIFDQYSDLGKVDLEQLCLKEPRLQVAKEIAIENKFFHWELEFADLFSERGGFDLIIGNPPWIKLEWRAKYFASEFNPLIELRNNSEKLYLEEILYSNKNSALLEYVKIAGQSSYISSDSNYNDLCQQHGNIYKCFVVNAINYLNKSGSYGLIHPEGLYDNPSGERFRAKLYKHLKYHFEFINEKYLFRDVAHTKRFSINIASNITSDNFITITNLFDTSTIDESFNGDSVSPLMGLKDEDNNWNVKGHPQRVINVDKKVLDTFGIVFDGKISNGPRMPEVHAQICVKVFEKMLENKSTIGNLPGFFCTQLMNETSAIKNKLVEMNKDFPISMSEIVYSGPNIWLANPYYKSAKYPCIEKSDYELVNLEMQNISKILPRTKYRTTEKCFKELPEINSSIRYDKPYKIFARRRLNLSMERTLISAIVPKNSVQIHSVLGIYLENYSDLVSVAACFNTIVYDFYIKTYGKEDLYDNTVSNLPIPVSKNMKPAWVRVLALNAIGEEYKDLWKNVWGGDFVNECWTKQDKRLSNVLFQTTSDWDSAYISTNDYERRQLFIELDVYIAFILGLSLDDLKAIYRLQFPVLMQYESDTWYDQNGRIVFTNNRSLTNVGFSRKEFEEIKDAKSGTFIRKISDDTMQGGPIERTIEYVAPFDRCDREKDYEIAWKFFEEKYGK